MRILIAEDDQDSRALLKRILEKQGYQVTTAEDGQLAWELFGKGDFRLVITDWLMPRVGGLELCQKIRSAPANGYVYIILVTAKEAKEDLVQAMDAGANDYVTKPYDKSELLARVRSGMRIVELEQQLSEKNQELLYEQQKSEALLLSIFPRPIAERLRQGPQVIAESFAEASVLFAGIHNFAALAAKKTPLEVVELLKEVFSRFDRLADQHGLEKIKTIGEVYMLAGGLPVARDDHAEAVAGMALAMQHEMMQLRTETGSALQLRIGIDSGPVIAGVIGTARLAYDLWGETVNTAEQMSTHGLPGAIQVSAASYERLRQAFMLEERGEFFVEGKGAVRTYLLTAPRMDQP